MFKRSLILLVLCMSLLCIGCSPDKALERNNEIEQSKKDESKIRLYVSINPHSSYSYNEYRFDVTNYYTISYTGCNTTEYVVDDDIISKICVEKNGTLVFYDKDIKPIMVVSDFTVEVKEDK